MNNFFRKYFPALPVALVLGSVMFSHSCANTTTPPSGGKKDTIPPVIVGLNPLPGSTNVPTHGTTISITFDEYITVKDPKAIYLSPPLDKMPKYRMRGKTLQVYFESDLRENTTYTLDLTGAIADNNEGNMYPGYTLHFSTGDAIDSMMVTGTVMDCNTLQPIKGATVMLYKDHADSAVVKRRPDASVKTDDWGYFSIRNIGDTLYRLYAIVDESGNNLYDFESDRIAFADSVIRPTMVVRDTLPELLKYDMKDTVHCMARKSEYDLLVFKERPSKQLVKDRKRIDDRSAYISFMAPDVMIDSLWVRGIPSDRLIAQMNTRRDSLELWINDRRRMPDTLHVFVDYLKTDDSTGTLKPFTEHLRLVQENKGSTSARSSRRNLRKEDTTCVITTSVSGETVEQYGFGLEFKYPIINEGFSEVTLRSVNPRQQEEQMKFSVTRDSLNLRKYTIMPEGKLQSGYEYFLKIPHRRFRDINGSWNDSTEVKVSLPNDDKLSTLTLNLSGVHHKYIVDLLNEKRDKTLRTYIVENDQSLLFPYLKGGKYSIRITEDVNRNGIVDTGDLFSHRQPEKVLFYKLRDGSYVIDIPESTEMDQSIDVAALFSSSPSSSI